MDIPALRIWANCRHPRPFQFLAGNGRSRRFRVSYFAQTPRAPLVNCGSPPLCNPCVDLDHHKPPHGDEIHR